MISDLDRTLKTHLVRLAKKHPCVTLTGPRQSGKTTLVRMAFPNKPYVNLEDPDIRNFALGDPRGFLNRYPKGAILDEFQRAPQIPSYLQGILDTNKIPGMFILTGSQQLEVMNTVSQSLAGRTAILKLLPFSMEELYPEGKYPPLNRVLWKGSFPSLYRKRIDPADFHQSYIETYLERDLRQLSQIHDLHLFGKFIRMIAGRVGQLLNRSNMANDLGVSVPTITHWLSILEAGYIIFLLEPFHRNLNKRLIKTPKLYFYDTGLACSLLGIQNEKQLESHPLRGALFENLIVLEFHKAFLHRAVKPRFSFYRDRAGHEVDLVWEKPDPPLPIEIKASMTYHPDFAKGVIGFLKELDFTNAESWVVYAGESEQTRNSVKILPWTRTVEALKKLPRNN